tara:strand:+ start:9777 stop:10586 length:810 start_codon:yes stop_codon:yes gene_type:complete
LNRITTNQISESLSTRTLLLDDNGRIIDNFLVLNSTTEDLLLVSDSSEISDLYEQITKYIILENITIEDISNSYKRISLVGNGSYKFLSKILKSNPLKSKNVFLDDFNFIVFIDKSKPIEWIDIIIQSKDLSKLEKIILKNISEISDLDFKKFRFHHLVTVLDEITGINPLELSLINLISFTKGCYIGQEVIARMDTYSKVTRKLVRLQSDFPFQQKRITTINNKNAGHLISYLSEESQNNKFLALALIKNKEVVNSIFCGGKPVYISD